MARQSFVAKTANCLASSTSRAPDVREDAKQLLHEILMRQSCAGYLELRHFRVELR